MREVKFRAWLPLRGEWYDLDITDSSSVGVLNVNYEYTLCQYTGLKDKNGVEIYEGDILRSASMPDSPVEYQRGAFNGVYADGSHDEWEAPLWSYTVEVIGNIYENPELLNK